MLYTINCIKKFVSDYAISPMGEAGPIILLNRVEMNCSVSSFLYKYREASL